MAGEKSMLATIFQPLNGCEYADRIGLEAAVIKDVVNPNIPNLPVGISYKDIMAGARQKGWLKINEDGTPGVRVELPSSKSELDSQR